MEERESNGGHNPCAYLTHGANVEVCSKEKGSEGAWFPATILKPPANPSASKRKTFTSTMVLIQYKTLVSDKDPTKPHVEHTTVALLRPVPPPEEEERFEQNDVVDAFCLDGWWPGLVMSVVGEKYRVGFKNPPDVLELERFGLRSHWDWNGRYTQEKEFSHSHIRVIRRHREWVDKHWNDWIFWTSFLRSQYAKVYGAEQRRACESSNSFVGKTPCHTKFSMKQLSPLMDKLPCGNTTGKLKISQHHGDDSNSLSPSPCKKLKGNDSKDISSLPQSYRRNASAETSGRKSLFTNEETSEHQQVEEVDSLAINAVKMGRQPNSQLVKRGRKVILQKLHDSNGSKIVRGNKEYIEEETNRGLHAGNTCLLPVKEINHDNEDGVSSETIGKEKQAELTDPAAGCMNDVLQEPAVSPRLDRNLATYQRKKRFHLTGVKSNATVGVTDVEVSKTNVVENKGTAAGTVNQQEESTNLPFLKLSPLWKYFESMEVFKKFPQKPHFRPLVKMKEIFREGSAIGSMSAFASLVEKIFILQVDDPIELVERYLEGLVELAEIGFDVKAIRHGLSELLDMKLKLGQLQNRSKEVETMITRKTHDTTTYDETITGVDKKIKDLQEERILGVAMKEVKVSEVSWLRAEATATDENIQRIRKVLLFCVYIERIKLMYNCVPAIAKPKQVKAFMNYSVKK